MPKYRRKSTIVEAVKITGPTPTASLPRWLLILMADGRVTRGSGPARLRIDDGTAVGVPILDNMWVLREGGRLSVLTNDEFMASFEDHGPDDE
jgi:hypothetical protein